MRQLFAQLPACIGIVAAVTMLACQYDRFASEFTRVKPSTAELVGVYELDAQSVEMLSREHVRAPASRFILRADTTFTLSNVPTCWRTGSDICTGDIESVRGTWQIATSADHWWVVRLRCRDIDGSPSDYGIEAYVRGDRSPRLLHFTVGDPDAGDALAFRKTSSEQSEQEP